VHKDLKDKQVPLVILVHKDKQVPLVLLVHKDLKDKQVLLVHKEQLDLLEHKVLLVHNYKREDFIAIIYFGLVLHGL
jgi:hypothetical protein